MVCEHYHLSWNRLIVDLRVARVYPIKAFRHTGSTMHAYIMIPDLSGSIDKIDSGKKKHSIVFIQINFLPGYMTFSPLPFLPYRSLSSESQTRQITIICCYKAFQESLTEVVKIWGLFMSLCIDLTLVRMNCRSIGLPLGRLNEQAQHWGLLLSASCSIALIAGQRWRIISSLLPSRHCWMKPRQRLSCNWTWFIFHSFSCICMTTTERYCDILPNNSCD